MKKAQAKKGLIELIGVEERKKEIKERVNKRIKSNIRTASDFSFHYFASLVSLYSSLFLLLVSFLPRDLDLARKSISWPTCQFLGRCIKGRKTRRGKKRQKECEEERSGSRCENKQRLRPRERERQMCFVSPLLLALCSIKAATQVTWKELNHECSAEI